MNLNIPGSENIITSDRFLELGGDKLPERIVHKDFKSQFPNGLTSPIPSVPPPTPDSLFWPAAITFDSKGNLYVSDSSNHRIVGYAPPFKSGQAAFITIGQSDLKSGSRNAGSLSSTSPVAGSLSTPFGITFSNSKLWIADYGNNRVLEHGHACDLRIKFEFISVPFLSLCLDKDLSRLKTGQAADIVLGQKDFTRPSFGLVSFPESVAPYDIVQGAEDNLWVSDYRNNRLLLYQPIPIDIFCNELIRVDRMECLSWYNELANVFVSFYDMTPAPFKNNQRPAIVIGQKTWHASSPNAGPPGPEVGPVSAQGLHNPEGLAVDAKGNLWVSDRGNNRVLKFDRFP
jgi:hypothetical protein